MSLAVLRKEGWNHTREPKEVQEEKEPTGFTTEKRSQNNKIVAKNAGNSTRPRCASKNAVTQAGNTAWAARGVPPLRRTFPSSSFFPIRRPRNDNNSHDDKFLRKPGPNPSQLGATESFLSQQLNSDMNWIEVLLMELRPLAFFLCTPILDFWVCNWLAWMKKMTSLISVQLWALFQWDPSPPERLKWFSSWFNFHLVQRLLTQSHEHHQRVPNPNWGHDPPVKNPAPILDALSVFLVFLNETTWRNG